MAEPFLTRALVHGPSTAARGQIIELRALVQHPMETGYRRASEGQRLARNLIRTVRCHFVVMPLQSGGPTIAPQLIFAATLHAAIAANPLIAFNYRAQSSGILVIEWLGDGGFVNRVSHELTVT